MTNTCEYPKGFDEELKHVKKCNRNSINDHYCIFHDPIFLNDKSNHELVKKEFYILLRDEKNLNFDGFILPSINFSRVGIKSKLTMRFATFTGDVNFSKTKFNTEIDFLQSKFEKKVNFTDTEFSEKIDFAGVKFSDDVFFANTIFHKITYFWRTKFMKSVSFRRTEFRNVADFVDAEFHGFVNFLGSKFSDRTDLRANFHGITLFHSVKFSNELTRFNSNLDFVSFFQTPIKNNIRFGDLTNWSVTAKIFDERLLERQDKELKQRFFYAYRYEKQFNDKNSEISKIEKEIIDLEKLSIKRNKETQGLNEENKHIFLKEMENSLIEYSKKQNKIQHKINTFDFSDDQEKYIQSKIKHLQKNLTLAGILSQYSYLRENHEFHHMYDVGGKFFVRASEVSRKYSTRKTPKMLDDEYTEKESSKKIKRFKRKIKNSYRINTPENEIYGFITRALWYKKIPNWVYFKAVQYGEDFIRPLVSVAFLFGIFTLGIAFFDNHGSSENYEYLSYPFERTISAIVPYISVHEDGSIFDYIIKAITLPFVGLSLIGLRRRFERKLRH